MKDIVKRLRRPDILLYQYAASVSDDGAFLREAADEIERLREALREITQLNLNDPAAMAIFIARAVLEEKE